jgi:serine O-acetyltransferase
MLIQSKKDLNFFIKEDSKNYPESKLGDSLLERPKYLIKRYLYYLRRSEYCLNVLQKKKGLLRQFGKGSQLYYHYKMRKLSWKLGFQFFENVLGPGVKIYAYGTIIINPGVKIGKNCTIYPGVTIGGKVENGCPIIGDNCFIGLGVKILGGIKIGDNCYIAPNAVVVKDVESNSIVGGVPAKFLKLNVPA